MFCAPEIVSGLFFSMERCGISFLWSSLFQLVELKITYMQVSQENTNMNFLILKCTYVPCCSQCFLYMLRRSLLTYNQTGAITKQLAEMNSCQIANTAFFLFVLSRRCVTALYLLHSTFCTTSLTGSVAVTHRKSQFLPGSRIKSWRAWQAFGPGSASLLLCTGEQVEQPSPVCA